MAKKRIQDIINRELILRTNNVLYRQEYGIVSINSNIYVEDSNTIYETEYEVDTIAFITVNGVTQTENLDYIVYSNFKIKFKGVVLANRNITVGYYYKNNVSSESVSPRLRYFYGDKASGKANTIKFFFKIDPFDGRDIFWSIHKDGGSESFVSGTQLEVAGNTANNEGSIIPVEYTITPEEAEFREGDSIPFTLIVIYDVKEGVAENEKLVGTALYNVDVSVAITGEISLNPYYVNTAYSTQVEVTSMIRPGTVVYYLWRTFNPEGEVIASGDQETPPTSAPALDRRKFEEDDKYTKQYRLVATIEGVDIELDTADLTVDVPKPAVLAKFGWTDSADRSVIIDLDTYNDTVQDEYLTRQDVVEPSDSTPLIEAPIPDYITGYYAFALIEVPKSWGNVAIADAGSVVTVAFDMYDINDQYTAYISKTYTGVSNPTAYKIIKL